MQLYPWQEDLWVKWFGKGQNITGQSFLLYTGKGQGKRHFAHYLSQSWLCESPLEKGKACGLCQQCHLFTVGTHPDFLLIEGDGAGEGKNITIDMIRNMLKWSILTPQLANKRIVVIYLAEEMNVYAANSILKMLEEPVNHTVFILLSEHPYKLLPTIRSRCQRIDLGKASMQQSIDWLHTTLPQAHYIKQTLIVSYGAPLWAKKLLDQAGFETLQQCFTQLLAVYLYQQEPLQVAEQWQKIAFINEWLYYWVMECIYAKETGHISPVLKVLAKQELLDYFLSQLNTQQMFVLLDKVIQWKTQENVLNRLLMIESFLLQWQLRQ